MIIKIKQFKEEVEKIKEKEGLSNKEISEIMRIDYTYFFRIFNQNATPGKKVIDGIENFCRKYNLNSKDYIFLE